MPHKLSVYDEIMQREDGCFAFPRCLECPFPDCLLDHPDGPRHAFARYRNDAIRARYLAGEAIQRLADEYGLSLRSAYRIARGHRGYQAR